MTDDGWIGGLEDPGGWLLVFFLMLARAWERRPVEKGGKCLETAGTEKRDFGFGFR